MKIGLVLEGGAFRTIFSCGVCDAFLESDFMPDYVVGVSAGITYGVSYLSKQKKRNLDVLLTYANDKRYIGLGNLLNPKNRCYFGLDFSYRKIPNELMPFDYDAFEQYNGEAEAVVTNILTGKAEYLPVPRRDKDFLLLQASCAIPLLFPIITVNGTPYLDGGCADSIPYERAFEKGCDKVIVVLTREREYVKKHESTEALVKLYYKKYPEFISTFCNRSESYNESREKLFRLEKEGKVIVIAPTDTRNFSRTERNTEKIMALWKNGYDVGKKILPEILDF